MHNRLLLLRKLKCHAFWNTNIYRGTKTINGICQKFKILLIYIYLFLKNINNIKIYNYNHYLHIAVLRTPKISAVIPVTCVTTLRKFDKVGNQAFPTISIVYRSYYFMTIQDIHNVTAGLCRVSWWTHKFLSILTGNNITTNFFYDYT